MENIFILGHEVSLKKRQKERLKGISIGDSISYSFYDGEYLGTPLLFVKPKGQNPTPRSCHITQAKLNGLLNLPVVFILAPAPATDRKRLIEKGVFFVMSNNYAYLPMLIANEKIGSRSEYRRMTPAAQYLLLYHLQVRSLEGLSARDITELVPYSYESVTLGISCLSDLALCEKLPDGYKSKLVHFPAKGRELWEKAEPMLIDPVEQRIYADRLVSEDQYKICGVNALAHYTRLNPDREKMVMMDSKEFRKMKVSGAIVGANKFDGAVVVEAWKYPAVESMGMNDPYVDRLSLVLSLKSDKDPRVEGEVEQLINDIEWKE